MAQSEQKTPSARGIAAAVLKHVLFDGAFAAQALDQALTAAPALAARDKALSTELVYGVLRTHRVLQRQLLTLAVRGIPDPAVLSHLMVAAYQMLLLDRVPTFAAVDEAVEGIKQLKGSKVGGFANALLRRLAKIPRLDRAATLAENLPDWLLTEMKTAVGEAAALGLLGIGEGAQSFEVTPQAIRFRPGQPLPLWAEEAERGKVAPGALLFRRQGDLRQRPEYAAGHFVIQEEGAQFAAHALGCKAGDTVLDACAGRGQKSSLLADQVGVNGQLWVSDVGAKKLRALEAEFTRLGLPLPRTLVTDWSRPHDEARADLPGDFDCVLVDAPCSGTGTLRRRPEISLRLGPGDVERLATLSEQILRNASKHARAGGRIVFVVCSVLARECERVIERVSDILIPLPFEPDALGVLAPGHSQLRLAPSTHATDGFFIVSLCKK